MTPLLLVLLAGAQNGPVESPDFPKELQASALRATVRVINAVKGVEGSGVIVKQDDRYVYILTAQHLVDKADKVEVHTFAVDPKTAKVYAAAKVLEQSKEQDLAMLRIATEDKMPGVLPLCTEKKAPTEKDFPGLSVGYNVGKPSTCRVETVKGSKKVRRPGADAVVSWEIGAAPAAGRSGGPLLDKRGYVLGVASGANDGLGYYVHTTEIARFLKEHQILEDLVEEEK
jgi:serine protease Do